VILLLDACVVIDFLEGDVSVLTLAANSIGEVYVPSTVLAEINDLDESRVAQLGLRTVEPTLELLERAATPVSGLSFQDVTLVLLAEERQWTCVTNDRALRGVCESRGVTVLWGLELLVQLVELRALPSSAARSIGEDICRANKRISPAVLAAFLRKLEALDDG